MPREEQGPVARNLQGKAGMAENHDQRRTGNEGLQPLATLGPETGATFRGPRLGHGEDDSVASVPLADSITSQGAPNQIARPRSVPPTLIVVYDNEVDSTLQRRHLAPQEPTSEERVGNGFSGKIAEVG